MMTCGTTADSSVSYLPLSNYGWNLKDSLNFVTDEYSGYKAVVIGGGTGAPVSIKTLLAMGVQTSAVVAMAALHVLHINQQGLQALAPYNS